MAEVVEFRTEETIPELESMLLLVFEKAELANITQMRKEHEYRLHRNPKRKEDCYRYIQNEMKIYRMIKLRHKKKGTQKNAKINNLEVAFGSRINKIFILTLSWFPDDLRCWVAYIRFCRQLRLFSSASRILQQMLDLHGSKTPELYKIAADWESKDCKCPDKARSYLLAGLHMHKDNKLLHKEAFRFELEDSSRQRKECLAKGVPIDPADQQMSSKKAECIYINSIKKFRDIELINDLLTICSQYDFTKDVLEKIILEDILTYSDNERMWDILANREWQNIISVNDKSIKKKIGGCVMLHREIVVMYESATKHLNTERMWCLYLDMMIEMNKDVKVLPVYKRKLLFSALSQAEQHITLPEKYYLLWVDQLQAPEKRKKLVETLQNAVRKLPHSVKLWHLLYRIHLNKGEESAKKIKGLALLSKWIYLIQGEEKQAKQVFKDGVKALGKDSFPLWNLSLMFEQLKRVNKVDEIFKEAWLQPIEISSVMRPRYLDWLVLSHGISAARKQYLEEGGKLPLCLEMHKRMIYLESIQPTINLRSIRRAFAIYCTFFGEGQIDCWLEYMKFEAKTDPSKVREVYFHALRMIPRELTDSFLTEINLLGINNIPSTNEQDTKPEEGTS